MRRSAIERLLPAVFQQAAERGGVLGALLDVMEAMHAPSERRLADVARLFSPYRAPDELVDFLATWVAVDHVAGSVGAEGSEPVPVGRVRNLVAEAARVAQWRGTAVGLTVVVEIVTDVTGVAVEEAPERPFHIVVRLPAAAGAQAALVERVVELERPAAVTYEVVVEDGPQRRDGTR